MTAKPRAKKITEAVQGPVAPKQVRIDFRKDAYSDFITGPPEPPGAMGPDDVRNLNELFGWEKYRLVVLV